MRTQLRQLIQNLLSNAMKYQNSELLLVRISAEKRDGFVVFQVRDNGLGIAPENRERIFEPFYRVHTREAIPGTGIGLGFCRGVVERHGGEIWVESELGSGSTFFFSLPAL